MKSTMIYYFQQNPDRAVTVEELAEAHPQWKRDQILAAMAHLLKDESFPGLEKRRTGVWAYDSSDAKSGTNVLTLEILKETEEYYIASDKEANVYRVTYLG